MINHMGEIPRREGIATILDKDKFVAMITVGVGCLLLLPAMLFLIVGGFYDPFYTVICCLAIIGSIPFFILTVKVSRHHERERAVLVAELQRLDPTGLFDAFLIRRMDNSDLWRKIELLKSKSPSM